MCVSHREIGNSGMLSWCQDRTKTTICKSKQRFLRDYWTCSLLLCIFQLYCLLIFHSMHGSSSRQWKHHSRQPWFSVPPRIATHLNEFSRNLVLSLLRIHIWYNDSPFIHTQSLLILQLWWRNSKILSTLSGFMAVHQSINQSKSI